MNRLISGIHHVTAISGDNQKNIDFYTGVLGLFLVKQTVNFDYPEVYLSILVISMALREL